MKKKYISTAKLKKWKVLDALSLLVPAYFCARTMLVSIREGFDGSMEGMGVLLVLCVICSFLFGMPFYLLWRSISRPMKRNEMRKTSFRAVEDLDYYRDKLTGLTPVEISMLTDLEVEAEKDLTAQLLCYELNGQIRIDGERVTVLEGQEKDLRPSDRTLLEALGRCGTLAALTGTVISDWKRQVQAETRQSKWFRSLDPKERKADVGRGCLTGCLFPIVIMVVSSLAFVALDLDSFLDGMPEEMGNLELARLLASDPRMLLSCILIFMLGGAALAALYWPLAALIRGVIDTSGRARTPYVRTAAGEQMTEYVYGMKNFLHDFSQLSEADKEHLVLWDDFLIYAVVLEENQQIVRDIFQRRNRTLYRVGASKESSEY